MSMNFGKYILEEKVGEGGTAEVYRAHDTNLKRTVALKLLKPSCITDETAFERFQLEAEAGGKLFHQNLATVLESDQAEGRFYIAMRYIDGKSLGTIIKEQGSLSWEEILNLAEQIGAALDYAHQKGFLHRDIKPNNILRENSGDYVLTDFGLARSMETTGFTSHTGVKLGTPAYLAPEIWLGKPASKATDIYALACVIIESITGDSLFGLETPTIVMKRHLQEKPRFPHQWPAGAPNGIEEVFSKALAQDPNERYQDMKSFVTALKEFQELKPGSPDIIKTPPPPITTLPEKPRRASRSSWILGLFLLVILCVIVGGGLFLGYKGQGPLSFLAKPTATATPTQIPTKEPTLVPTLKPTVEVVITPTLGVGSTIMNERDHAVAVYIPEGRFQMGGDQEGDEKPMHGVSLDAYYIYQYEVTNSMYSQCVEDGSCEVPSCDYFWDSEFQSFPVACVRWQDAVDYCEWAGGRLPTEAEWEKAARGGLGGKTYPWGNEEPTCKPGKINGAQFEACSGDTVPVGSFAPNGYGLYDMAGNVWEWTSSCYDPYPYTETNETSTCVENTRVLRGGGWLDYAYSLRVTDRIRNYPGDLKDGSLAYYGFRCVFSP